MGSNKALIPFLGRPLIERVVERVRPLADELLITTNEPGPLEYLGIRLVTDRLPGSGALGGLYTALDAAGGDYVAVVACDMPFANLELLTYQLKLLKSESSDAVVPHSGEGFEPFHAVYRRETCVRAVRAALERGERRLISWFGDVKIRRLEGEELVRHDPASRTFWNVNTPEEFAAAEQAAKQTDAGQSPASGIDTTDWP